MPSIRQELRTWINFVFIWKGFHFQIWSQPPYDKFWTKSLLLLYQFSLVTQWCPTLCDPLECIVPVLHVQHQLPEVTQPHNHWVGDTTNHLPLSHPLLLPPSNFPRIRVFSNESALQKYWWPKYWTFGVNINSSSEHPGLTPLVDWLDLLAVQWTLKSLLQHHSAKASILQCSAFFIIQCSHPYMTTEKTIALTRGLL